MSILSVRLGVLDFFRSLPKTLKLAPEVERMGYYRYWLAEHQPQPSPTLAAALVASLTRRIRVGTAAILFHFCSPAKTAYDFHLLEAAYGPRFDAGFCAGWAAPELLPDLLDGRPGRDAVSYRRRVASLINYLRTTPAPEEGSGGMPVWAGAPYRPPEIWVHGTGKGSVEIAAEHGIALGVSLFHFQSPDDPSYVEEYRSRFKIQGVLNRPCVAVAVAGICAETEGSARALLADTPYDGVKPNIVGAPDTWLAALQAIGDRYHPDDIIVLDLCRRYVDRLASYRLLAEAAGLGALALTTGREVSMIVA